MLASCLNFLDRQIFSILIPAMKAELNLSDTELGALSGLAFALFYSVLGMPIARLADRTDRGRVLAAAVALWSAMTMLCAAVSGFWQLALARMMVGVGEAGGTPPSHALLAERFAPEQRSMAMSLVALGVPLGILSGLLLGGFAAQALGWRWAFVLAGLPGLVLSPLLLYCVRDRRRFDGRWGGADTDVGVVCTLRALWSIASYRYLLVGAVLFALSSYGLTQWLPSFLVRSHGFDIRGAGLVLALLLGVVGGLGTFSGGLVADRLVKFDRRWAFWCPAVSIVLFAPCLVAAMLASSTSAFLLIAAIPVFLNFTTIGPTYAMVQQFAAPQQRAIAAAFTLLVINLFGLGVGPLAVGLIADLLSPKGETDALRHAIIIVSAGGGLLSGVAFLKAGRLLGRGEAGMAALQRA
ncbi:MFS transporter [Bradyrhizobium sp. CER78]|uniref:spinster family MFS transporter n=1 Tax=Bradyrhizobium sp. CER78 TaxID=3039162 RepID=UPI00244B03E6|nr:MFS transporter [Bradyrhizobium sp. CER78]MDH2380748.1 MFS transporter [Bradyrhizobium sp. CER78]